MQIFKLNTINNKKNLLKIKLCLNHIHFFAHMVRKYLLHKSLLAYTHNASFPQAHEYLRGSIKISLYYTVRYAAQVELRLRTTAYK